MNLTIGATEVDRFREHVAQRFGLNLENGLYDRIAEALERAVHRTGDADASCYVRRLEKGACSPSEIAALVEDLTVAETYFFRHPDQFRAALDRAVFERLRGQAPGRLRMLSAGCASGEEAYSLAILVRDNVPEDAGINASVLGIDLNANLLERGAPSALYHLVAARRSRRRPAASFPNRRPRFRAEGAGAGTRHVRPLQPGRRKRRRMATRGV